MGKMAAAADLVIDQGDDGYLTRLSDVAGVEVGSVEERSLFRGNGVPMVGLGIMKQSVAEDRTYNYEVWNQPIIEWKVNDMKELTEQEALTELGMGPDVTSYPYNDLAKKWFRVKATSYYITESHASTEAYTDSISTYTRQDHYDYILEVDEDGKINGGEWLGND